MSKDYNPSQWQKLENELGARRTRKVHSGAQPDPAVWTGPYRGTGTKICQHQCGGYVQANYHYGMLVRIELRHHPRCPGNNARGESVEKLDRNDWIIPYERPNMTISKRYAAESGVSENRVRRRNAERLEQRKARSRR